MNSFLSDGLNIAFETHGEGKPIVLIHGFASNGRTNWVDTGWVDILKDAGYGPVTIDNRGHGRSEKIYDPTLYPARLMARDVAGLIDHLGLNEAFGPVPILGYSMGARISAYVALDFAEKISSAVFGGLGINMLHGLGNSDDIVAGLLAPSLDEVATPAGRQFRIFAEHTGSDLRALATCLQSSRERISIAELGEIDMPVLVAVGDLDEIGGSAEELAQLLPKGEALIIKGRDHMRATGDKSFKQGVIEFLAQIPN